MKYLVIPLEDVENRIEVLKDYQKNCDDSMMIAYENEIEILKGFKSKGTILNLDSSIEERAEELYPIVDVDCGEFGVVDSNCWDRENYLEGYNDAQIISEIEKVEVVKGIESCMHKFGDAHTMLAKTCLSEDEYNPISHLLADAKVELFKIYNQIKPQNS